MMNGAGILMGLLVAWGQTAPAPAPIPEPRYYLIQVRIIEVDEQGKQTVVATPSLQTTGDATGVTVDPKRGRKFEFHFSAIDPNAPSTTPKAASDDPISTKAILTADGVKLDKIPMPRVSLKAVQQPRKEILKAVADQAGLQLVLDAETVTATAAPLLIPISLELQNTPVEEAIRQIVEPAKLSFSVRQDLVLIGASPLRPAPTNDATSLKVAGPILVPPSTLPATMAAKPVDVSTAANALSVRVYAVQDLVKVDAETQRPAFKLLIEQVQKTVGGEAWDSLGGKASIRGFDSTVSLVVRQTPAGHEAVAKLLADLRAKNTVP
ncbi:MAG: hypothetical protein Q8K78_07080 [Planctomycetaceae bacterium]|nr:hypothetical protein [Planctomycetaceae bacterium]